MVKGRGRSARVAASSAPRPSPQETVASVPALSVGAAGAPEIPGALWMAAEAELFGKPFQRTEEDARRVGAALRACVDSMVSEEKERLRRANVRYARTLIPSEKLAEWDAKNLEIRDMDMRDRPEVGFEAALLLLDELIGEARKSGDAQAQADVAKLTEQREAVRGRLDALRAYADARREATMAVLRRARPMGGVAQRFDEAGSHPETLARFREAEAFFPSDWLEKSRAGSKLVAWRSDHGTKSSTRGFYRKGRRFGKAVVAVDETGERREMAGAVHETCHRMEDVVEGLGEMQARFLERRCGAEPGEYGRKSWLWHWNNIKTRGQRPNADNPVFLRDGGFFHKYVGRDYGNGGSFEILATGWTAVVEGSDAWISAKDTDHEDFVLGVLAKI